MLSNRLFHDTPLLKVHNDKYAIHKINKHSSIGNRLRRYKKTVREYKPTYIAKIPNNI